MSQKLKYFGVIRTIVVAGIVAAVLGSSFAVASSLITSKNIKNGTIKPADLNKKLRTKINQRTAAAAIPGASGTAGPEGKTGSEGKTGPEGKAGTAGTPAAVGLSTWGPLVRNEFGSPVAETGNTSTGTPALILATEIGAGNQAEKEKAEYATETEFTGLKIAAITSIGFTENVTDGDLATNVSNEPNIQIEVNPKLAGKNYSSLVYNPAPLNPATQANTFVPVDAAAPVADHGTTGWYFSSPAVANASNCTQAHLCSLAEVKTGAPEAEVSFSVGLGKGRDYAFQGLISEFNINGTSYTFGPGGTFKK